MVAAAVAIVAITISNPVATVSAASVLLAALHHPSVLHAVHRPL
jgi:hypothetical protein